jgi:signal peptidase I
MSTSPRIIGFMRTFWRDWLRSILVVVLAVTSLRSAVADWNDVPTGSMKPSILEGDRIVVNKLAYDLRLPFTSVRLGTWAHPRRGDIVVLFSPRDGTRLVKRVVGLPGDSIGMRESRLVVNGQVLTYSPLDPGLLAGPSPTPADRVLAAEDLGDGPHPVMISPNQPAIRSFGPITVPEGSYFVMGDNRDESFDSRHFGVVPRHRIVGQALAVAASVDPEHHFVPRWRRFFQRLH